MSQYAGMYPDALRKELREKFPQCRGLFAAMATKSLCIEILEGQKDPDEAVREFEESRKATSESVAAPVELAEGTVSDGSSTDTLSAAALERAVEILSITDHAVCEEIVRVIEDRKRLVREMAELSEVSMPQTGMRLEPVDGKIALCGVDIPLITEPDSPLRDFVPKVDEHFLFDAWRAVTRAGLVNFSCGVKDVIWSILDARVIALIGPPSVAKTQLPLQIAARCGWPVTRFNHCENLTYEDMVGCWTAKGGATEHMDGPYVRAMRQGHLCLMDEFDMLPGNIMDAVLHPTMEREDPKLLIAATGEVVRPHPNWRLVLTGNTGGHGDKSGLHPSAIVQNEATLSRINVMMRVEWPTPANERKILMRKTGIDKERADLMVKVAKDTRDAVENRTLTSPITIRQTLTWAQLIIERDYPMDQAFALSVLSKADPDDMAAIAEIAQRHLGERFKGELASAPDDSSGS